MISHNANPTRTINRIDALANQFQQSGSAVELESELDHYDPACLAGDEKESWYHLK